MPLGGLHPAGCDDARRGWLCHLPPHPRHNAGTDFIFDCRVAELRARVAAHLRRQNRAPASRMVRGGIGFDLAAKTAMVGEQPLTFTRSEYAISEYLALHAGQTFSKEQIYEAVFGYDGTADDTAVTQHIKNIRAKLRTAGVAAPETVLKTIWGVGYQWKSET